MAHVPAVSIQIRSHYIREYSLPEADRFVFAYAVTLRNLSRHAVQLLGRYWRITDGNNVSHEVQGAGVIGEQPHIRPGREFHYTSGVVLSTPVGTMQGHYLMVDSQGEQFQTPIKPFLLALPYSIH